MWAKYHADLENMNKGIDEAPEGLEEATGSWSRKKIPTYDHVSERH